jgi:hypothetical protein
MMLRLTPHCEKPRLGFSVYHLFCRGVAAKRLAWEGQGPTRGEPCNRGGGREDVASTVLPDLSVTPVERSRPARGDMNPLRLCLGQLGESEGPRCIMGRLCEAPSCADSGGQRSDSDELRLQRIAKRRDGVTDAVHYEGQLTLNLRD